jgi:hypothetical protein
VRNTLKDDDHSGFNRLSDEEADVMPGASPQNLAAEQEAGAKKEMGGAQTIAAGAKAEAAGAESAGAQGQPAAARGDDPAPTDEGSIGTGQAPSPSRSGSLTTIEREPGINAPMEGETARAIATLAANPNIMGGLRSLIDVIGKLSDAVLPEGVEPSSINGNGAPGGTGRTVRPSIRSIHDVTPSIEPSKLPKMRLKGMTLAIENARGSVRRGANLDGSHWEAKMAHHYGFIKGVMGADGD